MTGTAPRTEETPFARAPRSVLLVANTTARRASPPSFSRASPAAAVPSARPSPEAAWPTEILVVIDLFLRHGPRRVSPAKVNLRLASPPHHPRTPTRARAAPRRRSRLREP